MIHWKGDFDPKNLTFWVFGGGGKEKWSCEYELLGFVRKQYTT